MASLVEACVAAFVALIADCPASEALVLAVLAEVAAAEALACAASRADWAATFALVDALDAVSALVA